MSTSTMTITEREERAREILAHEGLQFERNNEPGSKGYTIIQPSGLRYDRSIEDLESTASIIMEDTGTCCICGGTYYTGGNNPEPVMPLNDGENRCCRTCDRNIVIPARLREPVSA